MFVLLKAPATESNFAEPPVFKAEADSLNYTATG